MALEFFEKLFGKTADGQPEALTLEQLKAKVEAAKNLKVVNLEEGGYVSVEKFNAADTESKGYKKQLEDAQKEIKSYQDMDIEGIKKSASDWETKYKEDTKKLEQQLKDQQREFAEEQFLSHYEFADDFAKAGVRAEFRSKEFKYDEKSGTFLGAEDYMKGIMESHKGAFVIKSDEGNNGDAGNGGSGAGGNGGDAGNGGNAGNPKPNPRFLGAPGQQGAGAGGGEANPFGWNFAGVRPNPNAGKQ